MRALRRLIIAQVVLVAALMAVVLIIPEDIGVLILVLVLFAEPVADALALIYLVRLYQADAGRPRSWLLAFLVTAAADVFIGLAPIAVLALRRVFGFPALPSPINTAAIAFALIFIGAVPIIEVALFHLIRSGGEPV